MPAYQHRPSPWQARHGTGLLLRGAHLLRGLLATAVLAALVAGIPWGLVRYVGWPLPRNLPTWPETEAVLLTPMSTSFLTNTLACILWPIWGAFVLDLVRTTLDEVRNFPRRALPHPGPLNTLAAVLVGTILMTLISQRHTSPATTAPAPVATNVATATASAPTPGPAALIALTEPATNTRHLQRTGRATGTIEVESPRDGIYDSLWRIADRTLGDGNRWPEIYALNLGRPQPDGHALSTPGLIRPGWIFRIPDHPSGSDTPHRGHPKPVTPAPDPSSPPHTSIPTTPSPSPSPDTAPPTTTSPPGSTAVTPPTHSSPTLPSSPSHRKPGVSLPTGAFVGLGLAALISAALIAVRRRRRARYRPGSGRRDDLTVAPVVRALRLAYDDAARADDPDRTNLQAELDPFRAEVVQPPSEEADTPASSTAEGRVIGVKDGQALAWDLARARGLGLVGPGALDAVRALLVSLLAQKVGQPTTGPIEILIPASDARTLVGGRAGQPAGLRIVDDLDAALEAMEAELLTRTRIHTISGEDAPSHGDLVLVATPAPHADRRLQALLDNGSTVGLAGILVGQWRPGATARIRPDGTVAAISPSAADTLTRARLFTLPAGDAQALLALLDEAETAPPRPAPLPAGTALRHPPPGRRGPDIEQSSAAHTIKDRAGSDSGKRPEASLTTPDTDDPRPVTGQPASPDTALPPAENTDPSRGDPTLPCPLKLAVLGHMRLTHYQGDGGEHANLTDALAPRQREVLTYLALHRDGARRESVTAALWPNAPRERPSNAFHATVSQLRKALRTATHDTVHDITVQHDGRYALDRRQVAVDLWELQDALEEVRRNNDEHSRRTAVALVIALYTGDLGDDLTTEWIEVPREALRRDVLDVVSAMARTVRAVDPEHALALLERARVLDRYNEALYCDIAQLQAELGQHQAIPRTLALLTTTLAEIDDAPTSETVALCEALSRRSRRAS
ncbi:hypothetical protein [Streptomyces hokutonensis]|uniref:hypothetical protein n=1 Tax=Streptomyces hokutonensis TaxID=1306990 RepID=UPI003800AC83